MELVTLIRSKGQLDAHRIIGQITVECVGKSRPVAVAAFAGIGA